MTAGQLADLLSRVADLMDVATGKPTEGNQVRALAERVAPFAPQPLPAFGDFLALAAGLRDGELARYYPKPKPPPKLKPVKEPKPPPPPPAEQVAAAIDRLRQLELRALEPDVTPEAVDAVLDGVSRLKVADQNLVAAGCGYRQKFKKGEAIPVLRRWVLGRKGTFERAGA